MYFEFILFFEEIILASDFFDLAHHGDNCSFIVLPKLIPNLVHAILDVRNALGDAVFDTHDVHKATRNTHRVDGKFALSQMLSHSDNVKNSPRVIKCCSLCLHLRTSVALHTDVA